MAATDTHETIEQLLEAIFSVRSVLRHKELLPIPVSRESPQTEARRVGGWCEMVTSLRGREPGNRRLFVFRRCYLAAQ
jgi:hypothetical protein